MKHVDLYERTKHSILLPAQHRVTVVSIEWVHRLGIDYGINYVVTMLRKHWWNKKMKQCIIAVIGKCIICRNFQARTLPAVSTADLPDCRVTRADPFAVTGINYMGALSIKGNNESKVYIVFFTCTVTRAIHPEVVEDLCCTSFSRAFRRFCAK